MVITADKVEAEIRAKERLDLSAKDLREIQRAERVISATKALDELMKAGVPEVKWRIQNLVPESGIVIIGATAGSYKTYVAQHLALCAATGRDFLEMFEADPCNVLYVDEENGQVLLTRRFAQLKNGHELHEYPKNLYVCVFQGLKLDEPEGAYILGELIRDYGAEIVIIDSMVRFMIGAEDKASDVRKVFETLKDHISAYNCAFIILHHTTKRNGQGMAGLRGSGDFAAFADVVLMLSKYKGGIRFTLEKNRHIDLSQLEDFKVSVRHPSDHNLAVRFEYNGLEAKNLTRGEKVIDDLREWVREKGIEILKSSNAETAMGVRSHPRSAVYEALRELVERGDLVKLGRGDYRVVKGRFIEEEQTI